MKWNHRIVKTDEGVQFAEVFYSDRTNKPFGHSDIFTHGETVDELREMAERLLKAASLPVLDPAEFVDDEEE